MVDPLTIASRATRTLLVTALTGMGALHFSPKGRRGMAAMIPPRLRGRGLASPDSLVLLTGAAEFAGASGLLMPRTRRLAGAALVAYFAAVFPANAYAARDPERFGAIAIPFWPRLAGQVVLGALVVLAAARD